MGFDKARAVVAGEPMLARTMHVAREAGLEAMVLGRERPADWPADGTEFIADRWPGCGPMGGIATALGQCNAPVLALACDMPLLTAEAIRWLLESVGPQQLHYGFVALNNGQYEPLFSLYAQSALTLLKARLAAGDYALQPLLRGEGFVPITAPAWVCAQLANANTPDELSALGAAESR